MNLNLKGIYKEFNVSLKDLTVGSSSLLPLFSGPGHSVHYSDIFGREDPEGLGSIPSVIKDNSSRYPDFAHFFTDETDFNTFQEPM